MRIDKRFAAGVLAFIARQLWGFSPNLMPAIAEQLGGPAALAWFVRNMPRYESTLKTFGPLKTHLVCCGISLKSGCGYCVYGHCFALALHVFKKDDTLFPIDEAELASLCSRSLDERRAVYTDAARAIGAGLAPVEGGRGIQDGAAAGDSDDDKRLAHLVAMFSVLNACGVRFN